MLKTLVLLSLAVCLHARPDGAPLGACGTFQPEHGAGDQPGTPYVVNLSDFPSDANGTLTYSPGGSYSVVIEAAPGTNTSGFRGFLIQAAADGDTSGMNGVGSFDLPVEGTPIGNSTVLMKIGPCPNPGSSATHQQPQVRTEVTSVNMTWNAPNSNMGTLVFRYTVVENFTTWYGPRESASIEGTGPTGSSAIVSYSVAVMLSLLLAALFFV